MQRWLLAYVLDGLPVHPAAMAYRKGKSIFLNASLHADSRYLLRMDCKDFFPSITDSDLKLLIAARPAAFSTWQPFEVELFCKLVCKDGRLTIGAPTSPALSNAVCYELDSQLSEISKSLDITYSRYADDLFFLPKSLIFLQRLSRLFPPRFQRSPSRVGFRLTETKLATPQNGELAGSPVSRSGATGSRTWAVI